MSGDPLGILTPKKSSASNDPLGILSTPKKEQPAMPSFMDIGGATQQAIQTAQQNIPKVQQQTIAKPKQETGVFNSGVIGQEVKPTAPVNKGGLPIGVAVGKDKKKEGSTLGGIYNTLVSSFARFGGGVAQLGTDLVNLKTGMPYIPGKGVQPIYDSEENRAATEGVIEKARTVKSTKQQEQARSQFDLTDGISASDVEALAFQAPSQLLDLTLGALSYGSSFFIQAVNDNAKELEQNPNADKLSETGKLGYVYLQASAQSALDAIGLGGILKGTGLNKLVTKKVANEITDELVAKGGKATAKQVQDLAIKKASQLSSKIKKVGLGAATGFALEGSTEGAQDATNKGIKLLTNKLSGQEIFDEQDIIKNFAKDVINNAAAGGVFGSAFGTGTAALNNTNKSIRRQIAQANKPEDLQRIADDINTQIEQGNLTPQEGEQALQKAQQYTEIATKIPAEIDEETKYDVIGGIDQRNGLQAEIDRINEELKSVDPAFAKQKQDQLALLQDKLAEVNDYIQVLVTGEKPKYAERNGKYFKIDPATDEETEITKGHYELANAADLNIDNPQKRGEPEEISQPIELQVPNEIQETQVIQQKADEYKRLVEPEKPISEMNSEELYNLAIENRKALKKQDFEFKDKTEAEKEAEGYYNVIDDVEDLRDASERINFIENAENSDDIANSIKSIIPKIINNKPNEYQLAILNAAKRKTVELNINPKEVVKSILKKVASQYEDIEDAKAMVLKYFETLTKKPKADEGTITESEVIEGRLPESKGEIEPITTEKESIAPTKPIEPIQEEPKAQPIEQTQQTTVSESGEQNIITDKGKMEGIVTDKVEVGDEEILLPEKGYLISGVSLNEGEQKGKGFGQEIYKKALDKHGVLYSSFPISEDAMRVQNKLVEKGIAKIETVTLSDGTQLRKISPAKKQKVSTVSESEATPITETPKVKSKDTNTINGYEFTKTPTLTKEDGLRINRLSKEDADLIEKQLYVGGNKNILNKNIEYLGGGWFKGYSIGDYGVSVLFNTITKEAVELSHDKGGRNGIVEADFIKNNSRYNDNIAVRGSKYLQEEHNPKFGGSGHYKGTYFYVGLNSESKALEHGKNLTKVDLSNANLYEIDGKENTTQSLKKEVRKAGYEVRDASGYAESEYLKKQGYDGIKRGNEVVLFESKKFEVKKSTEIKSLESAKPTKSKVESKEVITQQPDITVTEPTTTQPIVEEAFNVGSNVNYKGESGEIIKVYPQDELDKKQGYKSYRIKTESGERDVSESDLAKEYPKSKNIKIGAPLLNIKNTKEKSYYEGVNYRNGKPIVEVAYIFNDGGKLRQDTKYIPYEKFEELYYELKSENELVKINKALRESEKTEEVKLGGLTEAEKLKKEQNKKSVIEKTIGRELVQPKENIEPSIVEEVKEGFTEGQDLNRIYAEVKAKYGDKKGAMLYDVANRLVNPNENTIIQIRSNGVVVKEGGKYILKPFGNTDANSKKWILYKGLDVSDQFAKPKTQEPAPIKEEIKSDLGTKARDLAAKVRSGEKQVLPDWLQASLPKGTKKQGIDINEAFAKALETFADIYDTTKDFAQAVEEGFKNIKDWFDENKVPYNEAELKEKFAQDRQGEIPTESQPPPPSEPPVSEQGEGKGGRTDERRFSKQMLETEDLVPEAKEGVKETLEYAVQTNAMSIQEASEILKKVGLDEGVALVMDRNNDMNGGVRVVMAQAIIKSYNELVKNAPDQATKDFYLDKVIQVAKNVTDKLATDPGQMIQAFSLWSTLTPEAQLRYSTKEVGEIGKARKEKQKKNINNIGNKFKKANEEAAEEVFNDPEVKNTINKNDSERAKKARVKIAKARQRRENILKKYKGQKGKNLFSTGVPGLSPEGIEFVGEVALTYIQEGIANVELLVEKIKQNLKEVSGKDVPDELTEQITQIADDKLNRSDERLIGKELKEQKLSINDIVKQHYTVAEKAKKSLADKLVEKAGLTGEEAADLAAKVEAAFDRIATRKKKRILFQEKARFDRIKNGMKGANTVDPKTLQGEMIRYSNLGAFENDAFADMIAEKLGTGKLTPQEAQRIIDLSEKVQNAPEGSPKNDATEDLLAYRANLKGTNWAEIAQGAWYANVLSGYKTHEKNIVSTFFNVVGELSAQSLKNPTEAPFILYGFLKGARRGGLEGIHTLVTGRSPIHVKKVETPNVLERKEFKGGYFNPANWLKFVTRAMVAEDVLMFQGLKEARAYQLALREAKKYGAKKGEIWKAVDELLLNTKQRYDEALAQAKSEGLASTIDIKRRVYELMEASRPVPMTEDAYGFAAEGTFNHETQGTLGAMSNAIAAFVDMPIGGAQPLRFIVPFTRIITNVVNQALNYTPVGLVRAARGVRGFRSFENYAYAKSAYVKLTPEQRKTIIAKASLGIGLAAALYALSKIKDEDDEPLIEITGGGTGDYKKDQQLREAGWQEYSIKVGDTYWSYKLTPLIFMLGFFGNMNDKEKYAKTEDDATTLKQMELAMWRNFNLVGELSWINTAGTLLGALQEGAKNKEDITRSLEQSMKGFLVPQAYTQAAQEVQKIFNMPQKRVENAWQNMIQDIPIARNSLNDKINVLGDPIIRDVDVINSEVTPDPVLKFLLDNNGWIAPVNKNSMIVYKNGIERDITEDEYYEFSKVRGQLVKQKIQKLMQSNLYKVDEFKVKTLSKGTPEYKRKLQSELSKIAQEATDEAKNKLMPKDLYIEITEEVSSSIENILNTR